LITREQFKAAVGREPEMDDLDRCNCDDKGRPGHWSCGWDDEKNLPVFMTGSTKFRRDD